MVVDILRPTGSESVVVPWSWLICFKAVIRREISETSEAVIQLLDCPRGKFFTVSDIRSYPNGVLPFFVPCGALRRAAEL